MRRWVIIALICFVVFSQTGCGDPTKPAGPGGERQQPYDPKTGQYK